MSLIEFCGYAAVLFACAVVVAALMLAVLLGACFVLGGVDAVSNPHEAEDARAEYQNVTAEIGAGTAGLDLAVRNVTGG